MVKSPKLCTLVLGRFSRRLSNSAKKSTRDANGGLYTIPMVIGSFAFVIVTNKDSRFLEHWVNSLLTLKILR